MSRRTSVRRFIPVFKATALQAVVVYFLILQSDTRWDAAVTHRLSLGLCGLSRGQDGPRSGL
jgi:hypothetical protein